MNMMAVINLLLGGVIGLVVAAVGFDLLNAVDRDLSIQTITNVVIGLATVAAVLVNCLWIGNQKDYRRWEVNKDLFLHLSSSLSDLMSQTKTMSDYLLDEMMGESAGVDVVYDSSLEKKFKKHLDNMESMSGVLLPPEIKLVVREYRERIGEIDQGYRDDYFDAQSAYDASYEAQEKLMCAINKYIKKYASL